MAQDQCSQREDIEVGLLRARLVPQHFLNAWLAFVLLVVVVSALLGLFGILGHMPEIRLSLTPLLLEGGV
jgi:hypothetical protein